jgi:hypothetical protein
MLYGFSGRHILYKCAACLKSLHMKWNDDMVTKLRLLSTSIYLRNPSHLRGHILPPGFHSDKYEALSVQLETVHFKGVCRMGHIKSLLDTVHNLSENIARLISDNASLKSQISKLYEKVDQSQGPTVLQSRSTGKCGNH